MGGNNPAKVSQGPPFSTLRSEYRLETEYLPWRVAIPTAVRRRGQLLHGISPGGHADRFQQTRSRAISLQNRDIVQRAGADVIANPTVFDSSKTFRSHLARY